MAARSARRGVTGAPFRLHGTTVSWYRIGKKTTARRGAAGKMRCWESKAKCDRGATNKPSGLSREFGTDFSSDVLIFYRGKPVRS